MSKTFQVSTRFSFYVAADSEEDAIKKADSIVCQAVATEDIDFDIDEVSKPARGHFVYGEE